MKIKRNIVTREVALAISSDYVSWVEGDSSKTRTILNLFATLKKGQKVLTYIPESGFVRGKITSVNKRDFRGLGEPVVRVGNGEYSWRCDGDWFAVPWIDNESLSLAAA